MYYSEISTESSTSHVKFSLEVTILSFYICEKERYMKRGKWENIRRDENCFSHQVKSIESKIIKILRPSHRDKILIKLVISDKSTT